MRQIALHPRREQWGAMKPRGRSKEHREQSRWSAVRYVFACHNLCKRDLWRAKERTSNTLTALCATYNGPALLSRRLDESFASTFFWHAPVLENENGVIGLGRIIGGICELNGTDNSF